jgi:hypothetical protein
MLPNLHNTHFAGTPPPINIHQQICTQEEEFTFENKQ